MHRKKEKIILNQLPHCSLFLEEYHCENAELIYSILDKEIGESLGWEVKNSAKELEKYLENKNLKFWSVFFDNKLVGGIFLDLTIKETNVWSRRMANLGYFIDRNYRGKGLISKAVPWVVKYALNVLKLNRIKAGYLENNIASRKIIEKNGFKLIGIERNYAKPASSDKYLNHYVYDLIPDDVIK